MCWWDIRPGEDIDTTYARNGMPTGDDCVAGFKLAMGASAIIGLSLAIFGGPGALAVPVLMLAGLVWALWPVKEDSDT